MDDFEKDLEERLKYPEFRKSWEKLQPRRLFRKTLIGARLKAGLTQKQLAELIGERQSAISRLESCKADPTLDMLLKLSRALGLDFTISKGTIKLKPGKAA